MQISPSNPYVVHLLEHLREEETLLQKALASLTDLYNNLRHGDLNAINTGRPQQEEIAATLLKRDAIRNALVARLSQSVGLPAIDINLSILVDYLPASEATELLAVRDRLITITGRMKEFHRRNAILVRHLRSYFRSVMSALAGGDTTVRYGPTGSSVTPRAGALIQARG